MASWEQFFSSAQASLTFVQHAVMSRRILCMPSLAMLLFAELHVISFLQWRVDEWYAIMRRCFLVNFRILLLRFWSWAHFSDYLFIIVSSFFFIVSWFLLSVRRAQFIFYFKESFPLLEFALHRLIRLSKSVRSCSSGGFAFLFSRLLLGLESTTHSSVFSTLRGR